MSKKLAVIGVGNMAKAIISGIKKAKVPVSHFYLFDINPSQCVPLVDDRSTVLDSIEDAVRSADCILLSVKPQNFPEILEKISALPEAKEKLYITIAAGITVKTISEKLGTDNIVRVLPNVPMLISKGVSVICYNEKVCAEDFKFVVDVFESAGSVLKIDESEMNRIICVTSSSPAYVFKFIKAIYDGAVAQGLSEEGLLTAICDMMIGSAELIKSGFGTPDEMVKAVASKGGTTERALGVLDENNFEKIIADAMIACTKRADELGAKK